jgi:hypothetical protein
LQRKKGTDHGKNFVVDLHEPYRYTLVFDDPAPGRTWTAHAAESIHFVANRGGDTFKSTFNGKEGPCRSSSTRPSHRCLRQRDRRSDLRAARRLLRSWREGGPAAALPSARQNAPVPYELRDVAPGLWIWRLAHPDWAPHVGWPPVVTSTCVESGGEVALLDPLAPPDDATEFWERIDARPPTLVAVLKPDHVRHVDLFVRRYNARSFGPFLFWRDDIPETELEPIQPGTELPGGLVAVYDGRGRMETPLWLPEQRALVFADGTYSSRGRASHLGDALARGARATGSACAARTPVRARNRLPRRAGARPGR